VFAYIFKGSIFALSFLSVLIFVIEYFCGWAIGYFSAGENLAGVEFVNWYVVGLTQAK
jgi:hypothetical protein